MTNIQIIVQGSTAKATTDGKITSGMVGLPVSLEYDNAWDGLTKDVFFKVGSQVRRVESVGTKTTVPWEILRHGGGVLEIGVRGKDGSGDIVLPTVWATVARIQEGANGEIPAAPNPYNGETAPSGSTIDDSVVSKHSTWSSKNTVDKLCPPINESGSVVACEPVEGYPLGVVSHIEHIQEGGGTPSPDNVRPIVARTGVTLTHSNEAETNTLTIDFGQDVYGGSLNWATGELVIDRKMITLGSENWYPFATNKEGKKRYGLVNDKRFNQFKFVDDVTTPDSNLICSKFPTFSTTKVYMCNDGVATSIKDPYRYLWVYCDAYSADGDLDAFKAMMEGTQIVFGLAEPITIQLAPQEILALSGVNTLYSDTGDTGVTGKADPVAMINKQESRIKSLEDSLTALLEG